jgi:hypothetical protein
MYKGDSGIGREHRLTSELMLDAAAGALTAAALVISWTGGGRVEFLGAVISIRSWERPAVAAVLLFVIATFVRRRSQRATHVTARGSRIVMGALATASLAVTFSAISYACGGLDSHGYVAFSKLLAEGRLERPLEDLSWLPVHNRVEVATPLGFTGSLDGRAIVPTYPPGLPLVMAVARTVGGADAVFLTAWLAGAALTIATFLVARARYGIDTALFAAVIVVVQPIVVSYSIQAMTDVPAALWTALAAWLLVGTATPWPVLAGVAGSLAILTRPPLGLAMAVLGGAVAVRSRRAALRFGVAASPGILLLMLLQDQLYGNPFVSGYGSAAHVFTSSTLLHNVLAHTKWLLTTETPLLIPLVWLGVRADRPFGRVMLALFAAVSLPYLFYSATFDDWAMTRYLLPGLVLLMPVAARGAAVLVDLMPSRRWRACSASAGAALQLAAAALVLVALSAWWLDRQGVFDLAQKDSKFPRVGAWFTDHTARDAVVLSSFHSGSINYYSGRLTLRFDAIAPDRLLPVVRAARDRGARVYLVRDEDAELRLFAARFGDGPAGLSVEPLDGISTVQIAELVPR